MKRDSTWTAAVDWLAVFLGLALGGAFFYAGLIKRLDTPQFAEAILGYDLAPLAGVGLAAAILPWVELASGFFLFLGYLLDIPGRFLQWLGFPAGARLVGGLKRRSCLLLIGLELVLFLVVLIITSARGLKIDCGCGLLGARQVGLGVILEDAGLLAVTAFLYWRALSYLPASQPSRRKTIDDFRGDYLFLANSAPAPVAWEGQDYPTVERAYQAAKTLNPDERELIRRADTPDRAKKLSRHTTRRPDWSEIRMTVMRELVRQKFQRHAELQRLLLATGDALLVAGNNRHDNFWGDCRCPRCQGKTGHNRLGRLLMEVRDDLGTDKTPGTETAPQDRGQRPKTSVRVRVKRCTPKFPPSKP